MSNIFPVGGWVSEEWYPGYSNRTVWGPWFDESLLTMQKEDENRFWLLEGHWPRGATPLCCSATIDVLWGTQWGANHFQLPATRGNSCRIVGTHIYNSDLAVHSFELPQRVAEVGPRITPVIERFPELWAERLERICLNLAHFEGADVGAMDRAALSQYYDELLRFHRWVWEVHFELMFPLIANYFGFRALCGELGVDEGEVARFFQGYDTKIMETDRKMWELAESAKGYAAGAILLETPAAQALGVLRAAGPATQGWLAELDAFLNTYGWRTEGMCDPSLAPWIEDPTPVLRTLTQFLRQDKQHDFAASLAKAQSERDEAIANARARLTGLALERFNTGLAACQHANFSWWQEEHDFYIDLRAHIGFRRVALRLGELVGADQHDDGIFLFRDETFDLLRGLRSYEEIRQFIPGRRKFFLHWRERRAEMPKMLGTLPETVDDPVMKEIFGLDARFIESVRRGTEGVNHLTGVPASSGKVRGIARVIRNPDQLGDLEMGEILVCEFTSPNWTLAFAQIAGCVADTGGVLSHTAIVAREYRIPCVTGVGLATTVIHTGDEIDVDGNAGTVHILARA